MAGPPYQSDVLEFPIVDPDGSGTKLVANEGVNSAANAMGETLTTDLTSETSPYVLPYVATVGGDKSGLHVRRYIFNGTVAASFQIEHPAVKHQFEVTNDGDDDFTILVNGQTGVLIPVGHTRELYCDGTDVIVLPRIEHIWRQVGDETTVLTTGAGKLAFRMPYAFELVGLPRISLTTANATGTVDVDINLTGTGSIFSTVLTIDATELTSVTATTPAVVTTTTFADDDEITVDIDAIGTGSPAGLKILLFGYRL